MSATSTAGKLHLPVHQTSASRLAEVDFDNLTFGKTFSDHMVVIDYDGKSWINPRIEPFGPLSMHPGTSALHYGQAIFEGMKAYLHADGRIGLFRPEMNIRRLNRSAARMAMPEVPEELMLQALRELVLLDRNWIPDREGSSLYIRPLMFASDAFIGIRVSDTYRLLIMTSPASVYYPKPVEVLVAQKYVRAFRGGTGAAKAAGNYGATMMPLRMARERGFDQLLWLDGTHFQDIHEIGTMNVFFAFRDKVVTPSTEEGTILEGVTRDSIIHLLRDRGMPVEERRITIDEVLAAYDDGSLVEMFGAGTAATVAQITRMGYRERDVLFEPSRWSLSTSIKEELAALRTGQVEDRFGWNRMLD
jgi:branched-chain amino acid aminotransferase